MSGTERFGGVLYRWRRLLWAVTGLCAFGFVAALFLASSDAGEAYLLGTVCAGLLALSLNGLGYAFREPLPSVDPAAPFLRRLGLRVRRAGRWLLGSLMLALVVAAVLFAVRGVGLMA
jgi:hypothetical protein